MPQISSTVLQGLAQPSFGRGMFELGSSLGGIPAQRREKQKQEKFNEIMKRGQAAMSSAEPDPVVLSGIAQELSALGYTKEAQQFADASRKRGEQAAQRARAGGLLTQAGTRAGITPQDATDFVNSGGTLEQLQQGKELSKQFAEPRLGRGLGELKAMAMQPGFDPTNPKMMEAYKGIARAYGVNPSEAMDILSKERGTSLDRFKAARTGTRDGTTTFASGGKYKDKRGLEYRVTEIRDPTGEGNTRTKYEPVGHQIEYDFSFEDGEGNVIQNRLTEKGGAYGETAGEKTERFEDEEEIKTRLDISKAETIKESDNFSDLRMKAAERLPVVEGTLADVNDLLEIVEVIDQGGSLVPLMNNIDRILGYEEKDPGKLRVVAKEILVGRIKSFGANPTEGERQYLEQLIPDLANSKGVNKEILERLQERLGREKAAIGYMFKDGANLDGYVNYVDALYSADTGPDAVPTGNKRVSFSEIQ